MSYNCKSLVTGIVAGALTVSLCNAAFARAEKVMKELEYRNIKVSLDGEVLDLRDVQGNSVEPFMFDGTNYLPVRALAESLGLNVAWDGANTTVVLTSPKTENTPQSVPHTGSDYSIGETWIVDGQWELTVTGVTETKDRNPYSDKNPGAVYIVDYTYKNLGYTDDFMDGLYIPLDDMIVDNAGKMGYGYPGNKTKYAQETPTGATCDAQAVIGVENPGSFRITVSQYDSNTERHTATFFIEI